MPRFFVFSDVHGFYDELQKALKDAGYDENNENHWLISCGDNWDRGKQPLQMFKFLNNAKRCILIRGNHEDLFEELIERGYPGMHDKSNGTYDTVKAFGKDEPFDIACTNAYSSTRKYMNKMLDYFETKNYVFVHGYIPIVCEYKDCDVENITVCKGKCKNPNWRNLHYQEWKDARWTNGIAKALGGLTIPDKTIVCGHWHCSYGHYKVAVSEARKNGDNEFFCNVSDYYEFGDGANFEPFYCDGLIAIDACTALTGKVNVLVIDDEMLE